MRGQSADQSGFTLLEVLIALAVLAIVIAGVLSSSIQQLKTQAYMEQKLAATHLVRNLVSEYRLDGLAKEPMQDEGQDQMGGHALLWRRVLTLDEVTGLHQVVISAGDDLENPLYSLSWRF